MISKDSAGRQVFLRDRIRGDFMQDRRHSRSRNILSKNIDRHSMKSQRELVTFSWPKDGDKIQGQSVRCIEGNICLHLQIDLWHECDFVSLEF